MPTLGEELKQRREQRGITLAEIAESTRIGTRFLKAIETDNFSILPGGIFTRSFIRAYAKHVGMNEEEAIGLYIRQVAGPSEEQAPPALTEPLPGPSRVGQIKTSPPPAVSISSQPVKPQETVRRFEPVAFRASPSRTSWPAIVIGAGIVVFVIIIVVALVKQLNQGTSESGSQGASVAQKNQPAPPPTSSATQPNPPNANESAASVPEGQPLVVKLEAATGDSWVKYQIDDAKPTVLVLKHGQSQDLPPAQSQVTLNYGNRTTLKIKINNRDANFPPDTPKFASHVVISRDNFQTYFQ